MAKQDINSVDIASLIDEQPLRAFHIGLVALVFLIMISDGYDQMVVGFAAAGMVKDLHFARSALGPIFSASLFEMLLGGPLFGLIGDRYGRRITIISGVMVFGVVSLATGVTHSQQEILALRFLTGLGLGGVPANAIALIAEYAPERIRATLLLGISKRGDPYLRTLLIHGARSVMLTQSRADRVMDPWLKAVLTRRPKNVAIVVLANKMARTIWALLAHGRSFDPNWGRTAIAVATEL